MNTPTIKITSKFIIVNGKRAGIQINAGGWVKTAPQDMIKVRCKRGVFPAEIRNALKVTNNSDMRIDYFEGDCLRLLPGDALYDQAKAAAQ